MNYFTILDIIGLAETDSYPRSDFYLNSYKLVDYSHQAFVNCSSKAILEALVSLECVAPHQGWSWHSFDASFDCYVNQNYKSGWIWAKLN